MVVANKEVIQGYPPDIQAYLDNMSSADQQGTIEDYARYERKAKREHNRNRKNWLKDFGEDIGPYKSLNEWFWDGYRKKQIRAIQVETYTWLGLEPSDDLTKREVRNAYRRQARKLHPDVGGNDEAFKQLHDAYRRLLAAVKE